MELNYTLQGLNTVIELPIVQIEGNLLTVNWGDGNIDNNTIHAYPSPGTYTITINGGLIYVFDYKNQSSQNKELLTGCQVVDTDLIRATTMKFSGCTNLTSVMSEIPPSITDLSYMFEDCSLLNDEVISSWSTQNVIFANSMFKGCSNFNQYLIRWYTPNVYYMDNMFENCISFNSPIFVINVINVSENNLLNCESMFEGCTEYAQNVVFSPSPGHTYGNFNRMFYNCKKLPSISLEYEYSSKIHRDSDIRDMFYGTENCNTALNNIIDRLIEPLYYYTDVQYGSVICIEDRKGWTSPDDLYELYLADDLTNAYSVNPVKRESDGTFIFELISDLGPDQVYLALINASFPTVYNNNFNVFNVLSTLRVVINTLSTINLTRDFFDGISSFYLQFNNTTTNAVQSNVGSISFPNIRFDVPGITKIDLYISDIFTAFDLDPTEPVETFYVFVEVPPIICFKEGTKILTNNGYVPIERLRKGQLIKTLNNYVPLTLIGKKEIYHPATPRRIPDQLYKCSRNNYPTLFEDLVLTGKHSVLVNQLTKDEEEKTKKLLGKYYITDNKYRLPSCIDSRSSVYEVKGSYTIYHIALENANPYGNYGIYANGLLVESCSANGLKSEMEIIKQKIPLLFSGKR